MVHGDYNGYLNYFEQPGRATSSGEPTVQNSIVYKQSGVVQSQTKTIGDEDFTTRYQYDEFNRAA